MKQYKNESYFIARRTRKISTIYVIQKDTQNLMINFIHNIQ